ncbi:MAG TPA: hypothetical protein VMM56_04010 [Planctomycetaceae bacterium]|nr:hypothetical protein [Planctomycetaceae bacterium]
MNQSIKLELDAQERNILLLGLRHVRSSHALAVQDPTHEAVQRRSENIRKVEALIARLNGAPAESVAANV